jgi:hypothetical protein
VDDIRVSSWNELNERLYEGSWREDLGRFRSRIAFRGRSDASEELRTRLMKLGSDFPSLESHILRNFRKYAQGNAALGDSIWNWLALAQHHGLPTRLLDWTYSPYVAAHFATNELSLYETDGVIWCVNFLETNRLLPPKLKAILEAEDSDTFTAEMLSRAAQTLREFDRLAESPGENDRSFVAFFEPPSLDERIVNQFALFSLMPYATSRLDQWLGERPEVFYRIIIPAALKWEVRDKLDQANITERVLFPGLDGLSLWLTRYYSARPPQID